VNHERRKRQVNQVERRKMELTYKAELAEQKRLGKGGLGGSTGEVARIEGEWRKWE